jgi:hypothetical protein
MLYLGDKLQGNYIKPQNLMHFSHQMFAYHNFATKFDKAKHNFRELIIWWWDNILEIVFKQFIS